MQKSDFSKYNGWLIINKDIGISSAKVINKIKKLMDIKKAGHAGTLDPLASGVLPVAIGEATKTIKYAMISEKSYEFEISWGVETATHDLEGEILRKSKIRPSKQEIINALPNFVGKIMQKPPRYSAIKIAGVRSYKLARNSIAVDIPKREIFIKSFNLLDQIDENKARFIVECGKGVYIRSLARDLAIYLNTYGILVI